MNTVSIIHCADVHIGMESTGTTVRSQKRKSEIKKTFLDVINKCRTDNIQLLLIPGDLFDGANVSKEDVGDVITAMADIPDTRVFIAPGNHDCVTRQSVYETEIWPDNVHIFKEEPESIVIEELGVRVWGCGFTTPYVPYGMLKNISIPQDELINIGVLHGDLVVGNGSSEYDPINDRDIAGSGLDYLALGHIHKQTDILRAGNTFYAYSGCPEGHGFDELGIKGVYEGTLERGKCNLTYVKTCKRRYEEISVDITGAYRTAEAMAMIRTALDNSFNDYEDNLYKVNLTGMIPSDNIINLSDLKTQLADFLYFVKLRDNTEFEADYQKLAAESSLRGVFTSKMLELIRTDEGNRTKYMKALKIGLKAFTGEVSYSED